MLIISSDLSGASRVSVALIDYATNSIPQIHDNGCLINTNNKFEADFDKAMNFKICKIGLINYEMKSILGKSTNTIVRYSWWIAHN